jgi:hypothetical protein
MRKRLFVVLAVVAVACLLSSAAVVHAQQIPATFFGLHVNQNDIVTGGDGDQWVQYDYWPTTVDGVQFPVQFNTYRTHDSGGYPLMGGSICGPPTCSAVAMKWSDLNPAKGSYTFLSNLDPWAGLAASNGQVILFTAYWTPNWASSNQGDDCAHQNDPNRPYGGCDLPKNSDGTNNYGPWSDFIQQLLLHVQGSNYASQFKYIEVWNEPNVDPNECRRSGGCTPAALAEMTYIVKYWIGQYSMNIQVISPPVTNDGLEGEDPYLQQLLDAYKALGSYPDVIGFHGYVRQPVDFNLTEEIQDVQTLLQSQQPPVTLPIYNTEGSWLQDNEWGEPQYEDQQAAWLATAYLVQAYYTTTSNPLTGYVFYGWDFETNAKGLESALWWWWGPPLAPALTEAGVAFTNVYQWLINATPTGQCTTNGLGPPDYNTEWTCQFNNSAYGVYPLAVWDSCSDKNYDCSDYVNTPSGYLWYWDLTGQKHPLPTPIFQITAWPILLTTK